MDLDSAGFVYRRRSCALTQASLLRVPVYAQEHTASTSFSTAPQPIPIPMPMFKPKPATPKVQPQPQPQSDDDEELDRTNKELLVCSASFNPFKRLRLAGLREKKCQILEKQEQQRAIEKLKAEDDRKSVYIYFDNEPPMRFSLGRRQFADWGGRNIHLIPVNQNDRLSSFDDICDHGFYVQVTGATNFD